ncbi:MAG TPA: F0F1 ATP synthase subunit epsilon [Firmicutes bacterium]|nr:F0F1 ATP synthase subunit epsilon [Bacillota bacterium]
MERRTFHLEVVTPQKIEYSADVTMIVAPAYDGYLGILPSHLPMVTKLTTGVLRIFNGEKEVKMAVSDGYMEVTPEKVIILAETAELPEELDIPRALAAKRRAEEQLAALAAWDERAIRAQASLQRALTRLKVAAQLQPGAERGHNPSSQGKITGQDARK